MAEPTLADYVTIIYNLYEKFRQTQAGLKETGAGYRYGNEHLIVFFMGAFISSKRNGSGCTSIHKNGRCWD